MEAARRAAEAVIARYHPELVCSVGFAGALHPDLRVGDIVTPAVVVDARDGSRIEIPGGKEVLVTFMAVAGAAQKTNLAQAYGAQAVDMEAAGVAVDSGTEASRGFCAAFASVGALAGPAAADLGAGGW